MSEALNPDQLRDLLGCSRDADVKCKCGFQYPPFNKIPICAGYIEIVSHDYEPDVCEECGHAESCHATAKTGEE